MSPITTHVLDLSEGRPASGVGVRLEARDGDGWKLLAEKVTDADGRVKDLLAEESLAAGTYRLTFAVGDYFREGGVEAFYPEAAISFAVREGSQHYHVPLLLSPFGYSTYRGS